jgi:cytochrome c peroxidase
MHAFARFAASLAALLALAASADAEESRAFPAPEPGSYELPPLGVAADGAVLQVDGRATTLRALAAGKLVLLAFTYAGCTDAEGGCPLATAVFHRVGRLLKDDATARAQLRVLTLSFDPERDTPAAMGRFAAGVERGGLDWHFLTTASPGALAPILADYGQSLVRERDAEGRETGGIAHVLRVFLIDATGRIRNEYSASFLDADLVVADVRTLLLEQTAP